MVELSRKNGQQLCEDIITYSGDEEDGKGGEEKEMRG